MEVMSRTVILKDMQVHSACMRPTQSRSGVHAVNIMQRQARDVAALMGKLILDRGLPRRPAGHSSQQPSNS